MKKFRFMAYVSGILLFFSAGNIVKAEQLVKIIPQPLKIINNKGYFKVNTNTQVYINNNNAIKQNIVAPLLDYLKDFYKIEGLKTFTNQNPTKGSIIIKLNTSSNLQKEGYALTIKPTGIILEASSENGLFYGIQTLIQIFPPERQELKEVKIPCVEIVDYPRFKWRGLHLDVGRHFLPKEFIFKYLDYMALHKFNTFHFHLTEDQGWRIEIKKYPKLTEVGSVRDETIIGHGGKSKEYDGSIYSGFYTQNDIREIVAYASARYITVVPEIEMPGHALAALTSYPELGCTGGPYKVATKWGVFDDVMCAGKEHTFEFLQDVIDEVISLFPSEYIHIGGDESPKAMWKICPLCQQRITSENLKSEHELQSYFIQRIEKYINKQGRKIIGWDEILEGGLAPNAAVMSWRGTNGGIEAAKQRHYVVMSPTSHCYFDFYQFNPATEPLAIGGLTTLQKVYSLEPVPPSLSKEESEYILGAQANLWTEYIKTPSHAEYMLFPRAAALSEVVWSQKESRDFADFKNRLNNLIKRYDSMCINYCREEFK